MSLTAPRHLILAAIGFSFAGPLLAQASSELADRIAAEGLKNSQAMVFQDILCNRIGHRLTGSDNFDRAAAWARGEFEKMGLEARLETWGEWKVRWNRGQWQGRILAPEPMELQVASPAWTGGTQGQPTRPMVRLPEAPDGLEAVLADGPAWLYGKVPRPGSEMLEALEQAARAGRVLGVVESARMNGAADNRRYPNQIRVFGDRRNAPYKPYESRQRLVHVVVRNDQAERLEALLDGDQPVEAQFEMRNRFTPGPVALHNVVADLVGTTKPDEMVIVCGHLDSWHQATGATDNGTGTCSTLEAARILTTVGARPERTIRFILWGGEEQGLLGSRQYVTQNRQHLDKVSAVFNHDSGTNWAHSLTVTTAMEEAFRRVLAPVMDLPAPDPEHDGETFVLNVRETIRASGGGSDHASFQQAGVPGWSWRLEGELPYGYGWHSQWDTFDLVVPEYQAHTATVAALTALGVANLPDLLSREGLVVGGSRGVQAQPVIENRLGVTLDGLRIKAVGEAGWAATHGLAAGDQVVAVNGRAISNYAEILGAMRDSRAQDWVIKVRRGDEEVEVKAK